MKRVALVTGASSGIGEATAELFSQNGYTVYMAARSMDKLAVLASDTMKPVYLDVTQEASMQTCVDDILKAEGRIDVLVNNAGYGSYGAVEDVPMEEARRQFDVNLFGMARMTQLVLPAMRENHEGKIINIASMGGRIWMPFAAWYNATKFAVEGLSASMRLELQPFGIDVIVIEPGGIQTLWGGISVDHLRDTSGSGAYADSALQSADRLTKNYESGRMSDPSLIARCIVKAATARRPRTRYLLGYGAKPLVFLHALLGDRLYDRIIRRVL